MLEPLASFGSAKGSSNTNLSRSVSFSILDDAYNEVPVATTASNAVEIIIPRDPNLLIPPMSTPNVTALHASPHRLVFYLHYLNLTSSLPVSAHWEMRPSNITLAYLLVYKFDRSPQLNSSTEQIDGWTLLCPSSERLCFDEVEYTATIVDLTNDTRFEYFLDNQRTSGHQALVFGLRELNATETSYGCGSIAIGSPPVTDERVAFTSSIQLRMFTSGCYYLDANNQWKADGLIVRTNLSMMLNNGRSVSGRSTDEPSSNAVLLQSLVELRRWFGRDARRSRLELRFRQCRFREEQDDLHHGDLRRDRLHRPADLRALLRSKRSAEARRGTAAR